MERWLVMPSSDIPVETIEDARSLAERNGVSVGIWTAQPNKGSRGFVIVPIENIQKYTERIEIQGFTTGPTGEENIPKPLTIIDPPAKYRRGVDLYRKQRSGWRKTPKTEQEIGISRIDLPSPELKLVAKIKMNKNEWVKIGKSQGWINSKDDPENIKVALMKDILGYGAMAVAPYAIEWMMGSGEQPSQDPQQFQTQMQQVGQEVDQQVNQILMPIIQTIQQQAVNLNAYCSNDTQSPPCPENSEVNDMPSFIKKIEEIKQKMKSPEFGSNPMYVCQIYREALELNSCAASIMQELNNLKNQMQNLQFNPADALKF